MTDPAGPPRRAWVEQVMGLPVSIHLRGAGAADPAAERLVAAVFGELRQVDATFSTYRRDSVVSRLRRGEVSLRGCPADVREVAELCEEAHRRTGGSFDAWLADDRGRTSFDPTGLVKGWALQRASRRLAGFDGCVNAGGDVAVTTPSGGAPWRVGIEDPRRLDELIEVLAVAAGGVATSGGAHRGGHIVDPATGRPADAVLSASVTGPAPMWADVYATAAAVDGSGALDWLARLPGYEALLVGPDGSLTRTAGWPGVRPGPTALGRGYARTRGGRAATSPRSVALKTETVL